MRAEPVPVDETGGEGPRNVADTPVRQNIFADQTKCMRRIAW